jgi:hypothetical protein
VKGFRQTRRHNGVEALFYSGVFQDFFMGRADEQFSKGDALLRARGFTRATHGTKQYPEENRD